MYDLLSPLQFVTELPSSTVSRNTHTQHTRVHTHTYMFKWYITNMPIYEDNSNNIPKSELINEFRETVKTKYITKT